MGWTGMRGVVALAAANSLPLTLNDGSPFPQRNFIIFLTFSPHPQTPVLAGLVALARMRARAVWRKYVLGFREEGEAKTPAVAGGNRLWRTQEVSGGRT